VCCDSHINENLESSWLLEKWQREGQGLQDIKTTISGKWHFAHTVLRIRRSRKNCKIMVILAVTGIAVYKKRLRGIT